MIAMQQCPDHRHTSVMTLRGQTSISKGSVPMRRLWLLPAFLSLAAGSGSGAVADDPIRFFEGRTESLSTTKVFLKKPYRTRSVGRGKIEADGTLNLVQRVEEEGKPPNERRWRIRRVAQGRFSGTMSEASGPVIIEQVGERFRFKFKMKGNLDVEQWVSPLAGGTTAKTSVKVKRLGMTFAKGTGTIRKLSD